MNINSFLRYFFSTLIFCLAAAMLSVWLMDPLQYYRRNYDYNLDGNDRWQVAGFIRTFEFDTIVVGTSMTQNFSLQTIKKQFGGNPIRLSLAGANILEQLSVLKAALKTGKVKRVIWGFDRVYLNYKDKGYSPSFPASLYDKPSRGQFSYLVNIDFFEQSISKIKKRIKGKRPAKDEIENYNAWYLSSDYKFSKKHMLEEYEKSHGKKYSPQEFPKYPGPESFEDKTVVGDELRNRLHNLENDVLPLITSYPKVKFHVFYPPYSIFYYNNYANNLDSLKDETNLRHQIIERFLPLKNVEFYDFETVEEIVLNLDHYKDTTHYAQPINTSILECMASKKHLVTQDNIDQSRLKFTMLPFTPCH